MQKEKKNKRKKRKERKKGFPVVAESYFAIDLCI